MGEMSSSTKCGIVGVVSLGLLVSIPLSIWNTVVAPKPLSVSNGFILGVGIASSIVICIEGIALCFMWAYTYHPPSASEQKKIDDARAKEELKDMREIILSFKASQDAGPVPFAGFGR